MTTMTIDQAQTNLKELIHQMGPGEVVVLTENQLPVARIVCEPQRPLAQRPRPGLGQGMITFIAPDFDAPLDDLREYME